MRRSAANAFFLAVFALLGSTHAAAAASNAAICPVEPGATVSDACASYADLDKLNARLNPALHDLVTETDFFSYYRLNLYNKKCPFWSDDEGLCGNIACAVTTLENEEDIPEIWRAEELSRLEGPKAHHPGKKEQRELERPLQGELGENVGESCVVEYDDECDERDYCVPEDESASAKGDYVSLLDNPERFTGYAGEGAHQIWEAIYRENCFSKPSSSEQSLGSAAIGGPFAGFSGMQGQAAQDLKSVMKEHGRQQASQFGKVEDNMEFDDECLEKRVFYRVISGMHASISTHLCYDYLNQSTGKWGPNLECYKQRLHTHPERISNLYFNYALMARAAGKLKDYVQDYTFCTGDPKQDKRTKNMALNVAKTIPAGPEIFDESVMFRENPLGDTGISLKEDFRNRFRNVSRIMDCVGCDKCRLWGKLQTAGYGTALKILFEFNNDQPAPALRRIELVAFFNTLDKVSNAIKALGDFQRMLAEEKGVPVPETVADEKQQDVIQEEEELDDDAWEKPTPKPKLTTWQETKHEIYVVWSVTKFILKSWIEIPQTIFIVLITELCRLWQRWLGLEITPRSWEFRLPTVDQL
ncbi:endoplasmic oxidoreductin [Aureobasidium pullulans]|uniref:Endoplasmic oxidoreductin n=1 Tax=Aureobasidium pullulans TaxID=5580 RepID=A0A4S9F8P7_AURPU|nr:endoplasmic oxidoreductin [Aureobasidium pullulans]THX87394.1 endoplasmic oxidoreductin [Aureobasidium pullulans]